MAITQFDPPYIPRRSLLATRALVILSFDWSAGNACISNTLIWLVDVRGKLQILGVTRAWRMCTRRLLPTMSVHASLSFSNTAYLLWEVLCSSRSLWDWWPYLYHSWRSFHLWIIISAHQSLIPV